MSFVTLESTRHIARHLVTVTRELDGRPIREVEAWIIPTAAAAGWCADPAPHRGPSGWWLEKQTGEVRVVSSDSSPAAEPLSLGITIPQGRQRQLLAADCMIVPLAGETISVAFPPAPMTVVVLATRADGNPSTGRVIELRGADATLVPLAETATGGEYRTAEGHVFTTAFRTFEVLVGNTPVRFASLDTNQLTTYVHIVDPT